MFVRCVSVLLCFLDNIPCKNYDLKKSIAIKVQKTIRQFAIYFNSLIEHHSTIYFLQLNSKYRLYGLDSVMVDLRSKKDLEIHCDLSNYLNLDLLSDS